MFSSTGYPARQWAARSPRATVPFAFLTTCFLVITSFQAGCTVRLIGDYDDTIDKGITDLQQRTETYFATLRSSPNMAYDPAFYNDASARLAVLKTRAASLEKYSIIVQQIDNLQQQYGDFRKLDQATSRPVPVSLVDASDNSITVSIESILKLELALKRGSSPSS